MTMWYTHIRITHSNLLPPPPPRMALNKSWNYFTFLTLKPWCGTLSQKTLCAKTTVTNLWCMSQNYVHGITKKFFWIQLYQDNSSSYWRKGLGVHSNRICSICAANLSDNSYLINHLCNFNNTSYQFLGLHKMTCFDQDSHRMTTLVKTCHPVQSEKSILSVNNVVEMVN